MAPKKPVIQVVVTEEQRETFKAAAAVEGMSMSGWVVRAAELQIANPTPKTVIAGAPRVIAHAPCGDPYGDHLRANKAGRRGWCRACKQHVNP